MVAFSGIVALISLILGFNAGASHRTVHAQTLNQSAPSQSAAEPTQAYEGIVTDSKCGAKHNPHIAQNAADCTRVCVHAGENFALVDGDKASILIGQTEGLKRVAGERVTIQGTMKENQLTVTAIRPLTR